MFRSAALLLLVAGSAAADLSAAKLLFLRGKAALEDGPIPPSVLECLENTDETSCNSAADEDGNPCDWCNTMAGFGLCMSQEASEMAKQFQPLFQCDGDEMDIDPAIQECLDLSDADSCDEDSSCDWCTTPFSTDYGACLTTGYAETASQLAPLVQCDGVLRDDPDDLLDCLQQADEDSCNSAVDEDGNSCAWCSTAIGGLGACLSSTYADMAKQFQPLVTCDGDGSEALLLSAQQQRDVVPPSLLDCVVNSDEQSCAAAVDEDGNGCSWCSSPIGIGACVSSDVADMAAQLQPLVQCSGRQNVEDPLVPPELLECLENVDEDDCNNAEAGCGWCNTMAGVDICLSEEYAERSKSLAPFVSCDGTVEPVEMPAVETPYDVMCVFAGYTGGGKAGCEGAVDSDSAACVWCTVPSEPDQGLCLNQDQANYAQQFLECEEPGEEIDEDEAEDDGKYAVE